jgi:hypothetical protein
MCECWLHRMCLFIQAVRKGSAWNHVAGACMALGCCGPSCLVRRSLHTCVDPSCTYVISHVAVSYLLSVSYAISHSVVSAVGSTTVGLWEPCINVSNGSIIVPAAIMPACHLHAWYLLTSPVFCDTHAWRIAANEGPAPVLQAAAVSACCQCAPTAAARCRGASFMFARA